MFGDAISYPTRAEDKVRTYGIATLLILGSILIIPAFFLLGYFVKVIRHSLNGSENIPRFEDFEKLFVDGLKMAGVFILYIFVPTSFISIIASAGIESAVNILFIPLILTIIYLLPSATVKFARNDRMLSAFNLKEVARKAFRFKYFKGLLLLIASALLITFAQIVISFLLIITLIGIPTLVVVWPVMRFYENLVYFRIMANMSE